MMTANSTDTRQSMECPPLEDIAAFIDGTLSPEERARVTEHLADCESCYEVFSGAVHFQTAAARDTGGRGVLRFPLGKAILKGLLVAASVVLVAGLGYFAWRQFLTPPQITLAGVIEPIRENPEIVSRLYAGEITRGHDQDQLGFDRPAFLVGVHLVDLRLSVEARNALAAPGHLQSLGNALVELPGFGPLGDRCLDEYPSLGTDDGLQRFAHKLPKLETEIEQSLAGDPSFSFGLWAEAGRLAAEVKAPELFKRRDFRRFLSVVQKDIPVAEEIREQVLADLNAIERTWDQGDLSQKDFPTLAAHFQSIIWRIDSYKENLLDEPDLPS